MAGELLSSVLKSHAFYLHLSTLSFLQQCKNSVTLLLPLPLRRAQSLYAQMQEVICQDNITWVIARATCHYRR